MAKTESIALATEQETAQETDPLIGSWAGFGAIEAVFEGSNQLHLVYPPGPQRRRYAVDPQTGLITARIA
jgi:hypothetical protein